VRAPVGDGSHEGGLLPPALREQPSRDNCPGPRAKAAESYSPVSKIAPDAALAAVAKPCALLGRRLTIRWRAYPQTDLNAAERAAVRDAPGGVLWVQLTEDWKAVKHDPSQHGRLSKKMAAALASWDSGTKL